MQLAPSNFNQITVCKKEHLQSYNLLRLRSTNQNHKYRMYRRNVNTHHCAKVDRRKNFAVSPKYKVIINSSNQLSFKKRMRWNKKFLNQV